MRRSHRDTEEHRGQLELQRTLLQLPLEKKLFAGALWQVELASVLLCVSVAPSFHVDLVWRKLETEPIQSYIR